MATLPLQKLAVALLGVVLIGSAPVAVADVSAPAHTVSSNDPDPDPAPLIQDPPEVQGPSNPGQKTLSPQRHRSRHRAPNST